MANAWKIARRSNVQLPLILVVALAVVVVLLGKAQGTLFDRMRAHATDTMAPVLEKVRERLKKLIHVSVGVDNDGSKIVLYQPNGL